MAPADGKNTISAPTTSENRRMNTTLGGIGSGQRPQAGAFDFNSLDRFAQPSGRPPRRCKSSQPASQFRFRRVLGQLNGARLSGGIMNRLQLAHVMRGFDEIGTDTRSEERRVGKEC